jgi:hypothetical protein
MRTSSALSRLAARLLLALASAWTALPASAAPTVAYQNTDSDTFQSLFFSTGPYSQLGDQVQLTAGGALASVETQFFNGGSADASFDAELRVYTTGAAPSQIGSSILVSNLLIASGQSLNVSFGGLGGLVVPDALVVMFSVLNVSTDGDIGLNLFEPPSVGQSDHSFFMLDDGTGIVQASTLSDIDNLYLRIAVTPVSEPGSLALVLLPLAVLAMRRRRQAS